MTVSTQSFEELSLANPGRPLELHRGQVREKPPMAWDHGDFAFELGHRFRQQLDTRHFRVQVNHARIRRADGSYYVPDIAVVPARLVRPFQGRYDVLPVLDDPLPLIVEVWSPSTGGYDVDEKLPAYRARGDHEIWRLHPYERTLLVIHRTSEGTYEEQTYRAGVVRCSALPNVEIDLDDLFAWARDIEG
jgi:Uma2 family endonuclease